MSGAERIYVNDPLGRRAAAEYRRQRAEQRRAQALADRAAGGHREDRLETLMAADYKGAASPLADKLLFLEAMAAATDLSLLELRAGNLLVQWYNMHEGCAYPSLESIAAALSVQKRSAIRVLQSLEAKEWFIVEHGSPGRGNASLYIPNTEKVTSTSPFRDLLSGSKTRASTEKGDIPCTSEAGKGDIPCTKRCHPVQEKVTPVSPDTFVIRSLPDRVKDTVVARAPTTSTADSPIGFQGEGNQPTNRPALEADRDPPRRRRDPDGAWIRRERLSRGFSPDEIGVVLNLTARQIEDIEDEHSHLAPSQRRKLKRWFEAHPSKPEPVPEHTIAAPAGRKSLDEMTLAERQEFVAAECKARAAEDPPRPPAPSRTRAGDGIKRIPFETTMTDEEFYRRRAQMLAELEAMDTSERKTS